MMQHLRNPKNVKLVSLFIAAIFVLGCFALSLTQSGFSKMASAAQSESAIGVVNYQMIVTQSPELANVRTAMQAEVESARKDFDEKSANMNDQEKQRYYQQLQERIANKEKELMDPLMKNIEAAIKKVADKKGLSVVVEKSGVIYGGVDITDEVAKSLQSAKK
ncbi:MAG: OmpH family outer membrane protein [Phascolarctobacterium sp.]|nr:OmpH family outer membrane protein [Phascolarctobacterium sp.]